MCVRSGFVFHPDTSYFLFLNSVLGDLVFQSCVFSNFSLSHHTKERPNEVWRKPVINLKNKQVNKNNKTKQIKGGGKLRVTEIMPQKSSNNFQSMIRGSRVKKKKKKRKTFS
jgi:hypothetical protein